MAVEILHRLGDPNWHSFSLAAREWILGKNE